MSDNESKPIPELTAADIARFWSHVDVRGSDECWPWKLSQFSGGYGQIKIAGRNLKAHRVAFFLFHGRDPVGLMACHTCDNPPCCNGNHLIDGTGADNAADCIARGRNRPAHGARHGSRTHPERWARGERVAGSKLTADQVSEIRALYITGAFTQQALADRFGVKRETVGVIVRGERWAHIGLDREAVRRISGVNRGRPGELHRGVKLSADQVREIRRRYASNGISQRELATEYGVTSANIAAILNRRTWKHVE